ncbi:gamma-thionin [Artemisia annua]|uniref:Gamma-thionin n=1 Tax=Artemisia annua TaxID=35608 RepID=A0A2U1LMJ2_ARTAN|nr:gamma-thionin [Artemisia annua]
MAINTKIHTFLFVVLFVLLLVVNPDMVASTKVTNKLCERRSTTWSGFCGISKNCDRQCREWEKANKLIADVNKRKMNHEFEPYTN